MKRGKGDVADSPGSYVSLFDFWGSHLAKYRRFCARLQSNLLKHISRREYELFCFFRRSLFMHEARLGIWSALNIPGASSSINLLIVQELLKLSFQFNPLVSSNSEL